jgi:hypothetical protein
MNAVARKKNEAAVKLANLRKKRLSPERLSEIASIGGKARAAGLLKLVEERTEEERQAIASKGGKARAKMPAKDRKEIARKAAAARWAQKREGQ